VIEHGERTLIPLARTLRLRLPGVAAGMVWSRPFGVVVKEGPGGLGGPQGPPLRLLGHTPSHRFIRVVDPTRRIQWALLAGGLATAILVRLFRR
jgi:hypothetical protein